MTIKVVRTAADDLADASDALRGARAELRNLMAHVDRMATASPDDVEAIGFQVRRSARIVESLLSEVETDMRSARVHQGAPVVRQERPLTLAV